MNKNEKIVILISFSIIALVTTAIIAYFLLSSNDSINREYQENNTVESKESVPDNKNEKENQNESNSGNINHTDYEPIANEINSVPLKPVADNQDLSVQGFWNAAGRNDKVHSTWEFYNGKLTVNGKYHDTYQISKFLDKDGYAVIYIYNPDGSTHILLLNSTPYGMEGLTAEGSDFENYTKNGVVPIHNQVIEFRR